MPFDRYRHESDIYLFDLCRLAVHFGAPALVIGDREEQQIFVALIIIFGIESVVCIAECRTGVFFELFAVVFIIIVRIGKTIGNALVIPL